MIDPIYLDCNGRIIRAVILENGIYFVLHDMCKFRGFRPATEKANVKTMYLRIKTLTGSTTVRVISSNDLQLILSHMHHMEQYADVELNLYRWFRGRVLPCLYKRTDCQRFIPGGPWRKNWEKEIANTKDDSLILSNSTDAEKERLHLGKPKKSKPEKKQNDKIQKSAAESVNGVLNSDTISNLLFIGLIDFICRMPVNVMLKKDKTEKQCK